ncbi:hybrid sensor histidine kinase/response regulator transcription factor [Puia sp.]|uniref:hybrid sensor histidine kinase/response regulator transcription factor n=1 Tax=Puia sp. TaxID=2045100 RepID=UPI002F3E87D6
MWRILIILGVSGFAGVVHAQGPRLRFTHLSGEQGLSNSTIEAICQDNQGFIWIGTRDGLNRYDGHEMVVYRNDPADSGSISDGYIRCIYEDRDHQLWIGTVNGLNRLDRRKDRFTRWKHRDDDTGSLSNSGITALLEDHRGQFWVATSGGMNLLDRKTGRSRHFRMGGGPGSLRDDRINCLHEDKTGQIWVGTQSGLDVFHPESGKFTAIENPAITNASGNTIIAIREDRQGNLWLGTEDDGLYLFDPLRKSFTRYGHSDKEPGSLGNNMIKCMLTDHKGQVWAGSINGGLNLFYASSGSFFHYTYEPGNGTSLSQRTISALFEDRQGNLWVGTHRGGINIYSPGMDKFNLYRQEPAANSLSYNDVKAFCEDRTGNIWVGTDGGGLDLFLRDERIFRHHRNDPYNERSIGSNAVLDVFQDREGELWVSTWGGGLNRFNRERGDFTRYQNVADDPHSISSNFVQKTFEDFSGNLWVATYYGGLNIFDRKKEQFTRLIDDPTGKTSLTGKNIVSLLDDKEGRIWIGTDDGGLNCWNESTRHFTHYFDKEEKMPDLRVLFVDSRGRLWVGQKGLYLFDAARDRFLLYPNRAGLAGEFIKGITEDGAGILWVATSNGLTRLDPETNIFKKYNTGDGLQDLEFEANAFLKTKDGEMYFGGINGFNSFYPGAISANSFIPPVYITGFQLSNRKVRPDDGIGPLTEDISGTKEIMLSYRQSTFSFTFSALNYTTPENNQYAYRLEQLDTAWNYVGKENKAVYTNLSPGSYVFRVKASNNDGIWNDEGASIRVVITPPFWRTGWFTTLLVALVVSGLYLLYKFRTRLKMRQLEEKKREEMRQVQLQFFTNVSHEFRTPLSLILGPLEKMMKELDSPLLQRYFQGMHRNAQRMLHLINELMDFGKLESGALRLCVQPGNLNTFMAELADEFRDWAVQKELDFSLQGAVSGEVWFDRQVLEKTVLNLLQNSFKYTNVGGRITLQVMDTLEGFAPSFGGELILKNPYRGTRYAYIRVADTGIGISANSIHHLFERYYRITESHLGSGVGLAFVKSLALLHKGDIYVYSERLKGTEIIIGIPIGEDDYGPEEKRVVVTEGGVRLESFPAARVENRALNLPPVETILLVEDNDELRHFLKECLCAQYQVVEAVDGRDGLTKAHEIAPGMIISDVIMPEMNGFDLCRAVKQDIDTCHIPFLMLTARTAPAAQLEGLDAGADYYFAKPLNMDLLLLTIRNRFDRDRKLKDRYSRDSQVEAMELVHSEKDREFMKRLLETIDSQLSNPDFDIEWLCQEMGMSRTKLYQKIKGISQQSIGDFIRTIRLKKAVQIMTHEDVTLTEVMMRIGIQTQSYFTKAFKKEFGKTPTQFMQEMRR